MDKPFVLIVEDERDIAALFRHVMDLAGYRTEIASNGTMALERLKSVLPDVVLLDLTLPGASGVEILESMHSDKRLHDVPVVVITAHYELAASLQVEPDLIMLKPVSAVQLTALVQRLALERGNSQVDPFAASPWDVVTGLYNHAFFVRRVDAALASLHSSGQSLFGLLALAPEQYEAMERTQG